MIDGNVNEFVDNLYYGSEMYFIFKGKKYFIRGWVKDSIREYAKISVNRISCDKIYA